VWAWTDARTTDIYLGNHLEVLVSAQKRTCLMSRCRRLMTQSGHWVGNLVGIRGYGLAPGPPPECALCKSTYGSADRRRIMRRGLSGPAVLGRGPSGRTSLERYWTCYDRHLISRRWVVAAAVLGLLLILGVVFLLRHEAGPKMLWGLRSTQTVAPSKRDKVERTAPLVQPGSLLTQHHSLREAVRRRV
jgi:hypothetical protein